MSIVSNGPVVIAGQDREAHLSCLLSSTRSMTQSDSRRFADAFAKRRESSQVHYLSAPHNCLNGGTPRTRKHVHQQAACFSIASSVLQLTHCALVRGIPHASLCPSPAVLA